MLQSLNSAVILLNFKIYILHGSLRRSQNITNIITHKLIYKILKKCNTCCAFTVVPMAVHTVVVFIRWTPVGQCQSVHILVSDILS